MNFKPRIMSENAVKTLSREQVEKLGLKTNFRYMKTGVKKYYRKLESRREFDEDPNFDKPNFKPSNKKQS